MSEASSADALNTE